ncbi:hypothetical protein KAFR_0E04495 [Kazachstania africana CBS 2517]|uniref:Uncharacterized protein n=1 Tax=Kazachstania africana (strain ATCC 22294 / BCRC 22015 / CBS 2517 / CECT 1963 / NBRC 1671 / NRRL Y-8276) TaxID=1071382 RepID=H2AW50_KAZAF|nr:hypothetical protein KAFR_0E04495 [Kazachstania africana CBS 2517]CCF58600.1 hypothetical protein KAFR_0E04495 [Kazachstania africana CBS 2517]
MHRKNNTNMNVQENSVVNKTDTTNFVRQLIKEVENLNWNDEGVMSPKLSKKEDFEKWSNALFEHLLKSNVYLYEYFKSGILDFTEMDESARTILSKCFENSLRSLIIKSVQDDIVQELNDFCQKHSNSISAFTLFHFLKDKYSGRPSVQKCEVFDMLSKIDGKTTDEKKKWVDRCSRLLLGKSQEEEQLVNTFSRDQVNRYEGLRNKRMEQISEVLYSVCTQINGPKTCSKNKVYNRAWLSFKENLRFRPVLTLLLLAIGASGLNKFIGRFISD